MIDKFVLKNGKELIVRSVEVSDYLAVQEYIEQLVTETQFTLQYEGKPRPTLEEYEKSIDQKWMLIALDGDKVVGIVSGHPMMHPWKLRVCNYGIHMLKAYHHNGLGHYFMNRLEEWARASNMHRIEGEVRAINMGGISLYLKHGFVIEGCKRDCVCIDGVWYSNYVIGKILD